MALTGIGFGMTVSYIDNGSNVVSRDYAMDPDITTYEDAEAAAVAMIPDIVAITDAGIPKYRVYQEYQETALVLPGSGVQVENTASITVQLAKPGNQKGNINIPAPKPAMFVALSGPQANIVNTGWGPLVTFTDNFLVAGSFTISDGDEITRMLNGKRVHKKSSRG